MNKLTIIGNLTADPQERWVDTASGQIQVATFTIAVNSKKAGKKVAQFFRTSVWGKTADNAIKYLHKGNKVAATGLVSATAYIDNSGEARASLEISSAEIEYLNTWNDSDGSDSQFDDGNTQTRESYGKGTQTGNQREKTNTQPQSTAADSGFTAIPDGVDAKLPWD